MSDVVVEVAVDGFGAPVAAMFQVGLTYQKWQLAINPGDNALYYAKTNLVAQSSWVPTSWQLVGLLGGGGGGIGFTLVTASTNYTASSGQLVEVDATSNDVDVTVPVALGTSVIVKRMDNSVHVVRIVPATGSADGAPNIPLNEQYPARWVFGNGSNLDVIGERKPFGSPVQQIGPPADGTSGKMMRADAVLNTYVGIRPVTGSTTLLASDHNCVVEVNSATAATVTMPAGLAQGFACEIMQVGVGQVTAAAGGGVPTPIAPHGLKTAVQGSSLTVRNRGSDSYHVLGDATT